MDASSAVTWAAQPTLRRFASSTTTRSSPSSGVAASDRVRTGASLPPGRAGRILASVPSTNEREGSAPQPLHNRVRESAATCRMLLCCSWGASRAALLRNAASGCLRARIARLRRGRRAAEVSFATKKPSVQIRSPPRENPGGNAGILHFWGSLRSGVEPLHSGSTVCIDLAGEAPPARGEGCAGSTMYHAFSISLVVSNSVAAECGPSSCELVNG